ncbi:hypothetical protein NL108_017560 [Boleophthalmus pectinirostris]|nr:hypothetical protein NL108_017560 [Boleophthalmus pectinirostris]
MSRWVQDKFEGFFSRNWTILKRLGLTPVSMKNKDPSRKHKEDKESKEATVDVSPEHFINNWRRAQSSGDRNAPVQMFVHSFFKIKTKIRKQTNKKTTIFFIICLQK